MANRVIYEKSNKNILEIIEPVEQLILVPDQDQQLNIHNGSTPAYDQANVAIQMALLALTTVNSAPLMAAASANAANAAASTAQAAVAGVNFTTSGSYTKGDVYLAANPTAGDKVGWVCTTTGTAGSTAVFKAFGAIDA